MTAHPWLTGVMAEIATAAGDAAALKLIRALGGQEIKLSSRKGGKLARIVGQTEAEQIVAAVGQAKITVPMAQARGAAGRRAAVARLIAEGKSRAEAARIADVHERTARRVAERQKKAPLPLFGED